MHLTEDTALALVHGRLPILVDTRDYSIAPHLLLDGFWKLSETEVFRNALRPGMTVVDVGASFGYFTLIAADAVGAIRARPLCRTPPAPWLPMGAKDRRHQSF